MSFEPFVLLLGCVLLPFGLGWTSRFTTRSWIYGVLMLASLAAPAFLGYLLLGYFLSILFPELLINHFLSPLSQELVFELSPLLGSLFFLWLSWKLFGKGKRLAKREEKLRKQIFEQLKVEIDKLLDLVGRTREEMESKVNWIDRRYDEVSASIKRVEKKQSGLDGEHIGFEERLNTLENRWGETHAQIMNLTDELKNFQETAKKAGEVEDVHPPAPPEKPATAPKRLTTEDGRRARLSGRKWQKWMGQLMEDQARKANVKINLENNPEKSKPDFVLRHPSTNRPACVGAGKSYTLYPYQPGRHKSSQRTVTSEMACAELKFAKRHKLPFFILVVNQRTGEWWSHIMSKEVLDSFERATTPSWLAEDQPPQEEVERNHQEFIEFLKSLV